jgi:ADP-ribose pyrophosphatase YjhB (NUDIX family)
MIPQENPYLSHEKILLAIDCIILGFDGKELKALFVKRSFEPCKGKWSLMGGFVKQNESVNDAAERVLSKLTGLTDIYMEQLYCFGDLSRDSGGRVVSIAYYALIKIDDYGKELMKSHGAKWFSLHRLPDAVFDHKNMLQLAKQRLMQRAATRPIGFTLLPQKFTLQQLQFLYEAIYDTQFDKRNFIRKVLSIGVLKKLAEKDKETSKKGSFYFIFDKRKYTALENKNIKFI